MTILWDVLCGLFGFGIGLMAMMLWSRRMINELIQMGMDQNDLMREIVLGKKP